MTDENNKSRTPEEQRVIDKVAERKGKEWAEEHAEGILAQAGLIGMIKSDE